MFMVKYKQRDIQKRIVIALALLCLVTCAVNVQFYMERQVAVNIVTHTATCASKLNQPVNYFDMSLAELMEVVVVSKSEERPSSFLLNSHCYSPDGV
jgi:uncharacterized protein YpuA (DUF1002 family)